MKDDVMKKLGPDDPLSHSTELVAENIARLKTLFPELVTEGPEGVAVNVDVLKALVGDETVTDTEEKYGLNWHGKRRARQLALTPSAGTLRPVPQESVDWETSQNLIIEGDNLEVLKLLQKSYSGAVKLIYIDPPYNTGKDFIYPDDFQNNIRNYLELTGQIEGGRKLSSNTEANGRFHTDWLNMIYPRLKLARNLLTNDGVIFISIDDAEVANLRLACDEIFGEENFVASFVRRRRMATGMRDSAVSPDHEYIVSYSRNIEAVRLYGFARQASDFPFSDEISSYRSTDLTVGMTKEMRPNQFYKLVNPARGTEYWPPDERVWRFEPSTMHEQIAKNNIIWPDDNPSGRMSRPRFKTRYFPDEEKANPVSTWIDVRETADENGEEITSLTAGLNQDGTKEVRELLGGQVLEYPKPLSLLRGLIAIATRKNDIVLDFFAGSGTTGHAVWLSNLSDGGNRRFIMVQLPEPTGRDEFPTIAEITKGRLRRAREKLKEKDTTTTGDIGFRVFKLSSSNIRAWEPDRDNLAATLEEAVEHLKSDRSERDVLYEMLLKLGLDLCVPIETKTMAGKAVHSIGGGVLIACLAEKIAREDIEELGLGIVGWHKTLAPAGETTCVFRDSAFADDVTKTNLAAILEQNGIATVRSL
jgi:adenine-specific DNA-methyltransferase